MGIGHVLPTIRGASSCNDTVKDKSYESSDRNEGIVIDITTSSKHRFVQSQVQIGDALEYQASQIIYMF
jgi:hypothetical protein